MVDLFWQAAVLMVLGMVFVYAFLGLLVLTVSKVITPLAKLFPNQTVKSARPTKVAQPHPQAEQHVVAAITAAVNQYRQKHSS